MRISPNVVVFFSVFALGACGGAATQEAKDANVWADFSGKYSATDTRGNTSAPSAKSADARRDAKSKTEAKEEAAAEETPATAAKKPSKATVKGESLSTIGDAALADASKGALKTKVVSTKIVNGPQYEHVKVQLKGATVQIIRPNPPGETGNGAVDAPKARSASLSKIEASYYDEEADVLVIVEAGKKANAEKALASIVAR
jgi:hypothetical protein